MAELQPERQEVSSVSMSNVEKGPTRLTGPLAVAVNTPFVRTGHQDRKLH